MAASRLNPSRPQRNTKDTETDPTFEILAEMHHVERAYMAAVERAEAAEWAAAAACRSFAPPELKRPAGDRITEEMDVAGTTIRGLISPAALPDKLKGRALAAACREAEAFEDCCRTVLAAYGLPNLTHEVEDLVGDLAEAERRLTETRAASQAGLHAKLAYAIGDPQGQRQDIMWDIAVSCLEDLAGWVKAVG